jgi:adenylate kinase
VDSSPHDIAIDRMVILGPPASGKGTQGELLAKRFDLPHVSTGELLRRSIVNDGDPHGVEDTVARGGLVAEDVIEKLMLPELGERFLLDGYPRSRAQADRLDRLLEERSWPIEAAVELVLSDEILAARMALRADQERRTDDRPEVFLRRLEEYNSDISALREHYDDILVSVDAEGEEEEILERIVTGLRPLGASPDGAG